MFDQEEDVAAAVSQLLQATLAPGARVTGSEALTQERSVWRCRIDGPAGLPRSVIARASRATGGWRTDPSYLRNDYAATAFLQERCPGVTARIVAADLDAGLYLTEDLGTGPTLGELLAGTDRSAAAGGLIAFASALGRMHAATAGLDGEYYRRRRLLGPADQAGCRTQLGELSLDEAAGRVLGARLSGRAAPPQASTETQAILAELDQPGEFLVLSNGDPCPYNCLVRDGDARLFDFELAGYRHALLDVAYLQLGFQWCYQPGRIPPDVLAEADNGYRAEASRGIPAAADDSAYQRALSTAVAAWAILSGGAVLRLLDRGVPAGTGDAARLVATLREYAGLSGRNGCYPALSHWIAELARSSGCAGPASRRSTYRSLAG